MASSSVSSARSRTAPRAMVAARSSARGAPTAIRAVPARASTRARSGSSTGPRTGSRSSLTVPRRRRTEATVPRRSSSTIVTRRARPRPRRRTSPEKRRPAGRRDHDLERSSGSATASSTMGTRSSPAVEPTGGRASRPGGEVGTSPSPSGPSRPACKRAAHDRERRPGDRYDGLAGALVDTTSATTPAGRARRRAAAAASSGPCESSPSGSESRRGWRRSGGR